MKARNGNEADKDDTEDDDVEDTCDVEDEERTNTTTKPQHVVVQVLYKQCINYNTTTNGVFKFVL